MQLSLLKSTLLSDTQMAFHTAFPWLETGITDALTLDQQSARAQEQEHLSQVSEEFVDYREQD